MMLNAWNRMCALDDEFLARFISIFNIVVSFITQLSLWMLGAFTDETLAQLKGSYMNTLNYSYSSLFLGIFYGFICFFLVILCFVLVYQKLKNNNIVNPQIGNFNNNVYNEPLVTMYQAAAFLFPVSSLVSLKILEKFNFLGKNPIVAITAPMFCFVLFPIILLPNKMKCIKFLLREIF